MNGKKIKNGICGIIAVCLIFFLASADMVQAGAVFWGVKFVPTSRVESKVIEGQAICENNKSTTDSHTESVTTSKTFQGTFSESLEVDAFLTGLKVSAEVSYGSNTTRTSSHTWNIPAHSTYVCQWGYVNISSGGYMKKYEGGILVSSVWREGSLSQGAYYGGYLK